jgi:hypothetical protein
MRRRICGWEENLRFAHRWWFIHKISVFYVLVLHVVLLLMMFLLWVFCYNYVCELLMLEMHVCSYEDRYISIKSVSERKIILWHGPTWGWGCYNHGPFHILFIN